MEFFLNSLKTTFATYLILDLSFKLICKGSIKIDFYKNIFMKLITDTFCYKTRSTKLCYDIFKDVFADLHSVPFNQSLLSTMDRSLFN